jgi:2-C-methyl-D-erythritol 4-phosphate cytidylyltransferase / 2-C-methyl-D-erythritol 2,4-cyclodiphosphate synthase
MSEPAPSVAVIVVAAGSGSRLRAGIPKAFVQLAGRTILQRSLESVTRMSRPARIVVVVAPEWLDQARTICASIGAASERISIVPGGASRQASVAAGLAALDTSIGIVLVHDAARVLTPSSQLDRVAAAVERTGHAVIPGLAVADTIKRTDAEGVVLETVDRSTLCAVQTPQGFPRPQLDAAYAAATAEATDDAALVAGIGHPVMVIDGDPLAFKITTPSDLHRAEHLLAEAPDEPSAADEPGASGEPSASGARSTGTPRIGIGTDVHAFDAAVELWLAGLHWPGEPGLAGHSDGDAVAHAIVDAVLAAAGLGDIGSLFGTADPRFAGAHGDVFLHESRRRVEAAGFRIGNVSVQLIGNRPRFSPRRAEAAALLTSILDAPVSVSATTTDGLGLTGRGDGVAAIAVALLIAM